MKALIHIGIPKSGTSSIQACLGLNRDALAAQGLLYAPFNPEFGSQFEFAVTALEACGASIGPELERRRLGFADRADQRAYVAAYRAFLDQVLAGAGALRFIGSSEHIHAWLATPEQIAALDRFLCARFSEVRYLLYLRPQDELILSSYSEAVRRGEGQDFETYLARHMRLSHWSRLKLWHQVIGRERLDLRLTSPDALAEGDLLSDFCKAAQIDESGLIRPPRVNEALSAAEIALRRRLNRVLPVLGQDGQLHPLYRLALRRLEPLIRGDAGRLGLSDAQRAEIMARNHADNEKIRKRYFPERQVLF